MKTTLLAMLLVLGLASPACAQEKPAGDKPAAEKKDEPRKEEKPKEEAKITDAGQKLLDDVERVWKKYYELRLAEYKDNKQVNLDDDWNAAVKEAKNSTYKDFKEMDAAIKAMQKADVVFKREFTDKVNALNKEHKEAVNKWIDEQKTK